MTVYADTSWWLAYKSRRDANHEAVITLFDKYPESKVVWTPWQRVEVFNSFRQLERAGAIDPGDARNQVRLLEQEIRLGQWPHVEFDWRDAVRTASELGADALLTFDADQKALAEATGVRALSLTTRRVR